MYRKHHKAPKGRVSKASLLKMQSELYVITERYATAELGFICKIAEHMTANSNVVMFDGSVPSASMNAQQLKA